MNQAGQKENAFHAEGRASGKSPKGKAAAASVFPGGESSPSTGWSTVVSRTPLGGGGLLLQGSLPGLLQAPKEKLHSRHNFLVLSQNLEVKERQEHEAESPTGEHEKVADSTEVYCRSSQGGGTQTWAWHHWAPSCFLFATPQYSPGKVPGGSVVKNSPAMQEMQQKLRVQPLGWQDPLEKEMATPFCVLAWEI